VLARFRRLVGLFAVVGVVAGCQLDVHVTIQLDEDGSGVVTVAAGLDAAALARVGNLDQQLHVDDLESAGWTVAPPATEGDTTWVRASKPFDTPAAAEAALAELTAADGPFRDFEVRLDEDLFGTTYGVSGVVDLTGGPEAFGDDELRAVLGGDAFGGTLEEIERVEGRPIEEMVRFRVMVDLPGGQPPEVHEPSFADEQPTRIDSASTRRSGVASWAIWGLVVLVGVVVLVVLRQGFKRVRA
jgi:hypothetical protein